MPKTSPLPRQARDTGRVYELDRSPEPHERREPAPALPPGANNLK